MVAPLSFYQRIIFYLLICLAFVFIGLSLDVYLRQLFTAQNNPTNSIRVVKPSSLPIPDVYITWSNSTAPIPLVEDSCILFRVGYDDTDCQNTIKTTSQIISTGMVNPVTDMINWIRYINNDNLQANNIDRLSIVLNTTLSGLSTADFGFQILLYQRTEDEQPYSLEEVITKATTLLPAAEGITDITYSLNKYEPLNNKSYYLLTQQYAGFYNYRLVNNVLDVEIYPGSPLITINQEVVSVKLLNVISQEWSVITLCFLIITKIFTREAPKVERYFAFQDELSYITYRCRRDNHNINNDFSSIALHPKNSVADDIIV